IGPPVILMAAAALVAGFLLLIVAAVLPPLVPIFGWATDWSLRLCGRAVDFADRLPGGHIAVGDVPGWWLAIFYAGLLSVLILPTARARWRPLAIAGAGWLVLGLTVVLWRSPPDGLRVTFLAVGHGGCIALETPDGR